jgi:hypothetical protein
MYSTVYKDTNSTRNTMISRAASNRKNASNMPAIAGKLAIAGTKATEVAPTTSNSKDDSMTTCNSRNSN